MSLSREEIRGILSEAMVDADHMEDAITKIANANSRSLSDITEDYRKMRDDLQKAEIAAEKYKTEAGKVEKLQKELEELKAAADAENPFEAKYNDQKAESERLKEESERFKAESDKLKEEFEQYKADVEAREVTAKKREAYRNLLKESGVSEKRLDTVLKVTDVNEIEFNKDGSVRDADKLKESIASEWADFIEHDEKKGADVINPFNNTGGTGKTREEILAIKDTAARQQAIIENHEVFGF